MARVESFMKTGTKTGLLKFLGLIVNNPLWVRTMVGKPTPKLAGPPTLHR
jgi:hypothetical protein